MKLIRKNKRFLLTFFVCFGLFGIIDIVELPSDTHSPVAEARLNA